MKKGFTLIELIAVVVIMGLLCILAIPNLLNVINSKKGEISSAFEEVLISASKLYIGDNSYSFPKSDGNVYCITLNTLVEKDYLSEPVKDPINNNEISLDTYVVVNVVNNSFEYEINSECSAVVN